MTGESKLLVRTWTFEVDIRYGDNTFPEQLLQKILDYDDVIDARIVSRKQSKVTEQNDGGGTGAGFDSHQHG